MEQKKKIYRSKEFMRFCHENLRGVCCVCKERPWSELHHHGSGGGLGLKPSDLELARLCHQCHEKYGRKRGALMRASDRGEVEPGLVLLAFESDAVEMLKAYVEHLEQKRPTLDGCSMDQLNRWIATKPKMTIADRDWLVRWVDRRSSEMFSAIIDVDDE